MKKRHKLWGGVVGGARSAWRHAITDIAALPPLAILNHHPMIDHQICQVAAGVGVTKIFGLCWLRGGSRRSSRRSSRLSCRAIRLWRSSGR